MADQKYPPETAGSRAITAFPKANVGYTVSNIEKILTEKAKDFETIDLIYVVDENEVLLGVASIKEIHSSAKDAHGTCNTWAIASVKNVVPKREQPKKKKSTGKQKNTGKQGNSAV